MLEPMLRRRRGIITAALPWRCHYGDAAASLANMTFAPPLPAGAPTADDTTAPAREDGSASKTAPGNEQHNWRVKFLHKVGVTDRSGSPSVGASSSDNAGGGVTSAVSATDAPDLSSAVRAHHCTALYWPCSHGLSCGGRIGRG